MKDWLAALIVCFALTLAGPPPALAGEDTPPSDPDPGLDPGDMARDGIAQLMRALEAFIDMIPQYEMPEINEQGDIIIRRKHEPEVPPEEETDPDIDETRT